MRRLNAIFWLGLKELRSLSTDPVLLFLLIYAFTFAIYSQATGITQELRNASIAIVDEDRSALSLRIRDAFMPPHFRRPVVVALGDIDRAMDAARYTFVLDIPPSFAADVLAGRSPALQVNVDATAVMQAGIGSGYIQEIVTREIARFLGVERTSPVTLQLRMAFNPTLETPWFAGVMGLIQQINMLGVLLAGAAVVRERERGTLDHLLAMPVDPFEIAMAKIWSNALVITVATGLSLWLVVHRLIGMPIAGSLALFLTGVALYLFFATAIGILIGTVARSMPQLGLLFILIFLPMTMLSGGNTPFESMPQALQIVMSAVPSSHFVAFAQAILYRGAGFDVVWPQFLATGGIGLVVLAIALLRFRVAMAKAAG